jgi:folate-binding protein YgfZ
VLQQSGLRPLDQEAHELERIRLGLPAVGQELSEAYTPLEVGLAGLVAENKGCYTGQEVLARQLTYDKVTRALVRLQLSEPVPVGSPVWSQGRALGEITSAPPLTSTKPLALAVLKKPYHTPGSQVEVGAGAARILAEVLP